MHDLLRVACPECSAGIGMLCRDPGPFGWMMLRERSVHDARLMAAVDAGEPVTLTLILWGGPLDGSKPGTLVGPRDRQPERISREVLGHLGALDGDYVWLCRTDEEVVYSWHPDEADAP